MKRFVSDLAPSAHLSVGVSPRDSVLGEPVIDQAMDNVGKIGVGHLGNFYWLAGKKPRPSSQSPQG